MLNKVEAETAHPVTKLAHRLLALTALRPGGSVDAAWHELDAIEGDLWLVPAARMKLKLAQKQDEARDHLVPVTKQVREVIEAIRTLTGRGPMVFPNQRHAHKPMRSLRPRAASLLQRGCKTIWAVEWPPMFLCPFRLNGPYPAGV